MKYSIKLTVILSAILFSQSAFATQDCTENWTEACIGNPYGPSSSAGGAVVVLGLVGIGAYLYFISDYSDPLGYSRLMHDYSQGRGLRLTSYENNINVSLMSIEIETNTNKFSAIEQREKFSFDKQHNVLINLVKISTEY